MFEKKRGCQVSMILKQGSKEIEKTTKKMNFNILFLGGKGRERERGWEEEEEEDRRMDGGGSREQVEEEEAKDP